MIESKIFTENAVCTLAMLPAGDPSALINTWYLTCGQ